MTYSEWYEYTQVAHSDNLSVQEFSEKDEWYQALIVAQYRTKHQIDAVFAELQRVKDEKRRLDDELTRQSKPH